MNLFQLTYMSQSQLHPLGLHEELEIIQKSASESNREKQISGILIYRDGFFLQRLEGDRKAIVYLAERIAQDRRHTHFRILEQGAIEQRLFNEDNQLKLLSTKKETAPFATLFKSIALQNQTDHFLNINVSEALIGFRAQLSHVA